MRFGTLEDIVCYVIMAYFDAILLGLSKSKMYMLRLALKPFTVLSLLITGKIAYNIVFDIFKYIKFEYNNLIVLIDEKYEHYLLQFILAIILPLIILFTIILILWKMQEKIYEKINSDIFNDFMKIVIIMLSIMLAEYFTATISGLTYIGFVIIKLMIISLKP